jgi:hypothetical protein
MTRLTYLERRWPDTPSFQQVAGRWCQDQSRLLLDLVWKGYDRLLLQDLSQVPFSADDEAKEESLNLLLYLQIDRCKSGDEPFSVVHEVPEQTKRKRGRGKSPTPDIGFVLYDFPRTVWPLEAKVLSRDDDVAPYLNEIRSNFLTGRYATFSNEGAMVGYLLSGTSDRAFELIGDQLSQALSPHPFFCARPHRISQHQRDEMRRLSVSTKFLCHHLMLSITAVD